VCFVIQQTVTFAKWRAGLKALRATTAIRRRLERAQASNLGDFKPVLGDVSEMRSDVGPGYRLYFTIRDRVVVFLWMGGSKSTQSADIRRAVKMAREI
jgi:putative addiction module killer protein